MRDCFSHQISSSSCSNFNPNTSCISPALRDHNTNSNLTVPSTRNAVVCLYRVLLPNRKQILITLAWTKNKNTPSSRGLAISFDQDRGGPRASNAFELDTTNSRKLFRKLKGAKSLELPMCTHRVEVFWDLSSARYKPGPEPSDEFYLVIAFDSEIGLALGDASRCAASKKLKRGARSPSLISRAEYYSGRAVCSTGTRICRSGQDHDILIRCGEEKDGPVLSVWIDKKTAVIRVERLRWNFRGNRAILLDGLLVDVTWDVHDLFECRERGHAIFTFRARGRSDCGLWMEDHKLVGKDMDGHGVDEDDQFSLMIICACKEM